MDRASRDRGVDPASSHDFALACVQRQPDGAVQRARHRNEQKNVDKSAVAGAIEGEKRVREKRLKNRCRWVPSIGTEESPKPRGERHRRMRDFRACTSREAFSLSKKEGAPLLARPLEFHSATSGRRNLLPATIELEPETKPERDFVLRVVAIGDRKMVAVLQLHVVRSQISLGAPVEVIEDGPVQGLLVAGTCQRHVACVLVRDQGVSTGVEAGVLGLDDLIPEFIIPRSLGHELRGHRIGMVLPVADPVALLGLVVVVAGVQANEWNGGDVTPDGPRFVDKAIHIEMIVEAGDIEYSTVVPEGRGLCRIPREVPRGGGAAELIT